MIRFRIAATVAIVLALASSTHAEPAANASGQWFEFLFHGQKVGFMYADEEATTINDRPAIHVKRWSVISVRRTSQGIRIESTTDAWATPDGAPIRYKHVRVEGGDTRASEGYRDGEQFIIKHAVGANLEERKIPLAKNMYLASFLDVVFNKDLKSGKALEGQAIIEEDGEAKPFSVRVLGTEKRSSGEVFLVESEVAGIVSKEVVLPNGKTIEVEIAGLGAKLVSSTREKALVLPADQQVDVFSAAMFGVKAPLPSGDGLDRLVIKLRGKSGKAPKVPLDERQKPKPVGKDSVELSIAAIDAPLKSPKLPIAANAKIKPFLKETPYEPLNDEKLRGALGRVVGDTKDAWQAAKKINAFVYAHIQRKTLSRAFATASEALDTQEGDCTEHAVLFSALAKIAGIPTRLVTGLVYVGGRDNLFGYHEWVEVWMGNRWVAMDPTFGQDLADPTHIKFTHGTSDSDGLREAGLAAASLIGELELDVVEWTTTSGEKQKM